MTDDRSLVSAEARYEAEARYWAEKKRREEEACARLLEDYERLKRDLMVFYETEYHPKVGVLHERLDSVKSKLLRVLRPDLHAGRREKEGEAGPFGERPGPDAGPGAKGPERPLPPEIGKDDLRDLKTLYRKLVKRYHPDRARSREERERRTRVMAAVNEAYQERDIGRLRRCFEKAEREEVLAGGSSRERIEALRGEIEVIEGVRGHLRERFRGLKASETYRLWAEVRAGGDALEKMAGAVEGLLERYGRMLEEALARSREPARAPRHWLYPRTTSADFRSGL